MKTTKLNLTFFTIVFAALFLFLFFSTNNFSNPNGKDWKVPGIAKKIKNPVPSTQLSIKLGKKLYAQSCAICHGESGIGDGAAGKYLGKKVTDLTSKTVTDQEDGVLFYKISKGRAPMPAFKTILKTKQRWAVINYLRTLKSN